jgi:hypothetical protein
MSRNTLQDALQRRIPNGFAQIKDFLKFNNEQTGEVRYLDAQKSVTSSTTLADAATDMYVPLKAKQKYEFEAVGAFTNSGGTQGGKVALTLSGTQTSAVFSGAGILGGLAAGVNLTANSTAVGAAVAAGPFVLKGTVVPQNDGNLSLQFAQNVSGGTASILTAGAILRVRRID